MLLSISSDCRLSPRCRFKIRAPLKISALRSGSQAITARKTSLRISLIHWSRLSGFIAINGYGVRTFQVLFDSGNSKPASSGISGTSSVINRSLTAFSRWPKVDAAKFSADHFQNRTDAPVEIITLNFRQMLAHAIRVNLLNTSFPCLQTRPLHHRSEPVASVHPAGSAPVS